MVDRRILGNHLGLRFLVFAFEKLVTTWIYGWIYGLEFLVTKVWAINYLGHLVVDFGILSWVHEYCGHFCRSGCFLLCSYMHLSWLQGRQIVRPSAWPYRSLKTHDLVEIFFIKPIFWVVVTQPIARIVLERQPKFLSLKIFGCSWGHCSCFFLVIQAQPYLWLRLNQVNLELIKCIGSYLWRFSILNRCPDEVCNLVLAIQEP